MNHPLQKDFEKLVRSLTHRHQLWRVFSDFCEVSALALVNAVEKNPEREARYLKVVGGYTPEEAQVFPKLLGMTALGLEELDRDFLGEMFMALELGSHWHGQFFTPMAVCRTIAELTLTDADPERIIADRGFVTVQEPAAGAGAMVIAFAGAMKARGLNPQTQSHTTAIDLDSTAAHMAFVQLSLLGLPAVVYRGDTLLMKMHESFATPFHHLGFWEGKVHRGFTLGSAQGLAAEAHPAPEVGCPVVAPPPPVEAPAGNRQATEPPSAGRRTQLRLF